MISESRRIIHQTTVRTPVRVSGVGMHTGATGEVTVSPAPEGTGIQIVSGGVRIPARTSYVVNTMRCTCLGKDSVRVETVEHLLSALYGLQIDNAEVVLEGPEIPILDGSAKSWVEALQSAGIAETAAEVCWITLSAPVVLHDGETWLTALPSEQLTVTCLTDYSHPLLGAQASCFSADPAAYALDIAPARTFGFRAEVEALQAAGLARGGSLDNALIVYDDHFSDSLRVPDECLRHKVLDLWGDISLVGGRLRAAITAVKPGHRANTRFAALIESTLADEG